MKDKEIWGGFNEDDEDPVFGLKYSKRTPKQTDFKIEQNISQINKREWEDIENEFYNFNINKPTLLYYKSFLDWMKENYLAPEKKNT